MTRFFSKALFITFLSCFSTYPQAESPNSLTIYTEQFPPYNFEVNNRLVGINLELTKAACELANIDCQFELYPWNRSMKLVQENPFSGIVSTARTSDRETMFEWVGPFSSSTNCLFKLSSRKDIVVNDIATAQQYVLGGSTDNAYKELREILGFEEGKNLILFNGKYGTLKPFAAGRVDLVVMSSFSISRQLEIAGLSIDEVTPVFEIDSVFRNGNYLALNKAVPEEIVSRLKIAMTQLFEDKAQTKIEAKYIGNVDLDQVSSSNEALWNACAKRQITEQSEIPISA